MPLSAIDEIQARDTAVLDQQLRQAAHAADWTSTFSKPGSTDRLRAEADVSDLMNKALERKMALQEQTDRNATGIYSSNARTATARYNQIEEKRTLDHLEGFMTHMADGPDVTEPGYESWVKRGFKQYPRAATTKIGKDTWERIGKTHDLTSAINQLDVPEGAVVTGGSVGRKGPIRTDWKAAGAAGGKDPLEAEAKAAFGVPLSALREPLKAESGNLTKDGVFEPAYGGDSFRIKIRKDGNPESITMSRGEYERYGLPVGEKDKVQVQDKKSIAQAALDDPEATEAEKAQARKLLGK